MSKLWFRSKRYGLGWYPVTEEGWLVLAVYIICLVGESLYFTRSIDAYPDSLNYIVIGHLVYITIITSILIFICYKKGEPLKWHWGDK